MALVKKSHVTPAADDERGHGRDLEGLLAELTNPQASARRWAARDLADYPMASAALARRLVVEPDVSVQDALLMSLTQIGDPTAVVALVNCLRSENASLRNQAIEAMKLLPDAVAPIMAGLLADPDPDVRIFAVNVLESLRHPDVESWLIEVITDDEHVNVCATAVDLLGEVGTEAALEPLRALKRRFAGEPYIEFAADLAIKRLGQE